MSQFSREKLQAEFNKILSEGRKYLFEDQLERARAEFLQAQEYAEKNFGVFSEELDEANFELIGIFRRLDEEKQELALLQRLVERRRSEKTFATVPSLVNALIDLARCENNLDAKVEAKATLESAIQVCDNSALEHLHSLQKVYYYFGRFLYHEQLNDESLVVLRKGLKLHVRNKMSDDMWAAKTAMYYALVLWNLNRQAEAADLTSRSYRVVCHHTQAPSLDFNRLLYHIGGYYDEQAQYQEAESILSAALFDLFRMDRPNFHNIGMIYSRLGDIDLKLEKKERAEYHLRRALKALLKHGKPSDRSVLNTRQDLANILLPAGRYAEAEPLLQEGVDSLVSVNQGPSEILNRFLNNLGFAQVHLEEFPKAEANLRRALSVAVDDLDRAFPLKNLGLMYQTMGYVKEAIDNYQQALVLFEGRGTPEHPQVSRIREALSKLQSPA
jgi:tetratricopeptide (TPR) repeat protein